MNLIQCDVNTGESSEIYSVVNEHFWKRFYNEYSVALRERMMYDKTKRSSEELPIGDVVVIKDNTTTPHSKWKHRRVTSLIKGLSN